ncbi:hypothetical protein A3742_29970 [Oleiphilus sp. HI0071]|nr:hypothetical protein A3742_29970 [Oleiphilus sp. HI0071]
MHKLVASEQLEQEVDSTINQILQSGPSASKATKTLIADIERGLDQPAEHTAELIARLRVSEEGQAGLTAFFEKQSAPWIKQ